MDLVKAISALSDLKNKLTYYEVIEAKEIIQEFEVNLGNLIIFYEKLGLGDENLVQLIATFDKMKQEILEALDG